MTKRSLYAVPILTMCGAVLVVAACYSPTEVRLEISREALCGPPGDTSAGIFIGAARSGSATGLAAPAAVARDCTSSSEGNSFGSLVVVPSAARDARVTVEIALSLSKNKTPEACLVDAKGCIVARRSFAFIEHTSRTLPIKLYEDCKDIQCDAPSTCVAGVCLSDDVDSSKFCDSREACALPPADAGADAAKDAAKDAPADGAEAGSLCPSPMGDGILLDGVAPPTGKLEESELLIHWSTNANSVASAKKAGGLGPTFTASSPVQDVAARGNALWYVETNKFHRVTNVDTAPVPTPFTLAGAEAIAVTASDVYVGTSADTFSMAVTSASATSLSNVSGGGGPPFPAQRVAVRGGYIYSLTTNGVHRMQLGTGQPFNFGVNGEEDLYPAAGGLYFTERLFSGGSDGAIRFLADTATDQGQRIAPSARPEVITHDGTTVYWTESTTTNGQQEIWKFVAGNRTRVAIPPLVRIVGLVVDKSCIYYWGQPTLASTFGAIRIAPK